MSHITSFSIHETYSAGFARFKRSFMINKILASSITDFKASKNTFISRQSIEKNLHMPYLYVKIVRKACWGNFGYTKRPLVVKGWSKRWKKAVR